MTQISGKQIKDESIKQKQLGIETPTKIDDATRKDYVDQLARNAKSVLSHIYNDYNMTPNATSTGSGYELAINIPILDDPIANSKAVVFVNGVRIEVGPDKEAYFSPDGTTKRLNNQVRIGDQLYWDSDIAGYTLDSNDNIDFYYLTNELQVQVSNLNPDTTVEFTTDQEIILLEFNGNDGDTATIDIDGVTYTVGQQSGNFVFDIGGSNETTFTTITDFVEITVNGNDYVIRFNGTSSQVVSIYKKQAGNSNSLFGFYEIEKPDIGSTSYLQTVAGAINNGKIFTVMGQYIKMFEIQDDNELELKEIQSFQDSTIDYNHNYGTTFRCFYNDKLVVVELNSDSNDSVKYPHYFKVDSDGKLIGTEASTISTLTINGLDGDLDDDQFFVDNVVYNYDYGNDTWDSGNSLTRPVNIGGDDYKYNIQGDVVKGAKIDKDNRVVVGAISDTNSSDKIIEFTWDGSSYGSPSEISLPGGVTNFFKLADLTIDSFLLVDNNLNLYVYEYGSSWNINNLTQPTNFDKSDIQAIPGSFTDPIKIDYDEETNIIYVYFSNGSEYYGVYDILITYKKENGNYVKLNEYFNISVNVTKEDGLWYGHDASTPLLNVDNNYLVTSTAINDADDETILFYKNDSILINEKYPLTKSSIPYVFNSSLKENTDNYEVTYDFFNIGKVSEGNSEFNIKTKPSFFENSQDINVNDKFIDKNTIQDNFVEAEITPETEYLVKGKKQNLKPVLATKINNGTFRGTNDYFKYGNLPLITLTINSGSINGNGVGVYNLYPNGTFVRDGTYQTDLLLDLRVSPSFNIYISMNTSSAYGSFNIDNSNITSFINNTTLTNKRIGDLDGSLIFKNYVTSNADFNLSPGPGWR